MIQDLFLSAVLSGIQTAINQVLSMDPGTANKLAPLSGKCLRIHCEQPALTLSIVVGDEAIFLSHVDDRKADVEISGSATALLKLLSASDTATLHDEGIVVTGNVSVLSRLQDIRQEMDLDWEYQLSKFIGDIPTQMISDTMTKSADFTRRTTTHVMQDLDNYLHDEKRLFPAMIEVENFYQRINKLRLRVDRLQSRVNRLRVIVG